MNKTKCGDNFFIGKCTVAIFLLTICHIYPYTDILLS